MKSHANKASTMICEIGVLCHQST